MKNKQLPHLLSCFILSFLLSFGGIGCLATAFGLEIPFQVLAWYCAIFALAGCVAFSFRFGGAVALGVVAMVAYYLARRTQVADQILQLCYRISRMFNSAYGCGWLGKPTGVESIALPLYLWGGLNALIAGWSMIRRRFTAVAIFFSLLPLALCLVLTDTIPAVGFLFTLLLALILLLLTQGVRRQDTAQAAALTGMLSIPVALALLALFLANPQASYDKQPYADKMGDALLRAVDRIPYVDINTDGTVSFNLVRHIPSFVDLQHRTPGTPLPIPVMEVTAESSGPLYLRGRDYDNYSGTRWEASSRDETFTSLHSNRFLGIGTEPQAMGKLTVKTSGSRSSRYLPYYPDMNYPLQDGACDNPSSVTTYSYNWYTLPSDYVVTHWDSSQVSHFLSSSFSSQERSPIDGAVIYTIAAPYGAYLQLPESTRSWAERYLQEHLSLDIDETDDATLANAIADLVRNSALYDLDTRRMPEAYDDLARWFLEESDTGYCVHYATATTVLLRAAGIPARYVEGYLTEAVAGRTVTVTEKDAHAWAEYFILGFGWIPLESTAADLETGPDPLRPTEATTHATEEPTTQPTEESTAPTPATEEPSSPSTAPSESTAPSAGRPGTDTTAPPTPGQLMPGKEKGFTVSKPLVITLCLLILLAGQYPLRLKLRTKVLQTGSTNSRAIKYWRYARRLAKLAREPLPEVLEELALRARFSQHQLTQEDLAQFDAYYRQTTNHLRRQRWWLRLYHRLIWAAY